MHHLGVFCVSVPRQSLTFLLVARGTTLLSSMGNTL
jgi:hypothetical protein